MTIIYIYMCVWINFLGGWGKRWSWAFPLHLFRQDVGEVSPKNTRASPEQVRPPCLHFGGIKLDANLWVILRISRNSAVFGFFFFVVIPEKAEF